jgi:hypothetical protein
MAMLNKNPFFLYFQMYLQNSVVVFHIQRIARLVFHGFLAGTGQLLESFGNAEDILRAGHYYCSLDNNNRLGREQGTVIFLRGKKSGRSGIRN